MRTWTRVPHDRPREERHQRRDTVTESDRLGARVRGRLRPVPVGRRTGRSRARSEGSSSAGRADAPWRSAAAPASTCPTTPTTSTSWSSPNRTARCSSASSSACAGAAGRARLVDAPAEQLPFPDGSVDTVVSTFVLCTVDDPELALREIVRVLRPDGQFLFLEHVRSDSPRLAAWQDRLAEPWRRFARGCRCNQATAELIATCGLALDDVHEAVMARDAADRPAAHRRARTDRNAR